MTAPPPGPRQARSRPSRTGVLTLAAALLLAVSGLFGLPEAVFSQAYYTTSWIVLAAVAPVLTVTTLVLAAAAVARGSRTFLLVVGVGTLLHLVALIALGLPASGGLPTGDGAGRLWSGPAQLLLALACLVLAWWITSRTDRRPWAPLVLVALAPLLGRITGTGPYWEMAWWPVLVVALGIPAVLTILAAGLVCLPDRGPQITGAVLIVLAGLGRYGSELLLGRQPNPEPFVVMGLALACAVAGILGGPRRVADDAAAQPGQEGPDRVDGGAPAAPAAGTGAEVVTTSDTTVVVVPSPRPEADEEAGGDPSDQPGRSRTLALAALAVLVLTVGLDAPRMFAHGPGIQPSGAGVLSLVGLLVDASMPTVFVLAAGTASLRSRGALLTATVCSGLLVIALLVSRTAADSTITLRDAVPVVALGLSIALAWTGLLRPGAHSATLRWAAAVPLVLAAPPLWVLTAPGVTMHASNPAFVPQLVLPILVSGLGPLLAAALLGLPRRGARLSGAVLLGLVAISAVIGTVTDAAVGLRLLAALNLLQVAGFALAAVLVVNATLAPQQRR
ncbi:hypothetical protein [Promicromonospora iranensis]|uniref:Uncharacterized protein n=1 Tax=Promicromonospora iranensis TaxID=1105144 RepID=A0ABU2CTL7_9MICO|nr:hypothetical protein [Promicromonospora iranensis]MDR7384688.1 hypothetical protein [Promicromonospora iranensis]